MGKFVCLCILLIIVIVAFCNCNAHKRDRKEKKGRGHEVNTMKLGNAMGKDTSHISRKHKSHGVSREKTLQDVHMYDVARFSKHSKSKSYKKRGKKHSRKGVSWIKFLPSSDCILKCQTGEMCIVGPLDAKPFCVGKSNIKKSIKLFHRYQKKEMKAWRKFSIEHYHKYSEKKNKSKNDKKKSDLRKLKEKHFNKKGHHFDKVYKQNSKPYFPPTKDGECSTADFAPMRTRMMGWFHVLHGQDHLMKKQEKGSLKHVHKQVSVKKELREHSGNSCQCFKSAIWQFSQMDVDQDDHLTEKEMGMIEENSLEPCIKPYLTSCDRDSDGVLSSAEWCCCFSNVVPPCFRKLDELRRSGDKVTYVPRCDKEGYYMREQCQGDYTEGQYGCWCVDYNGNEYKGTHTTGRAHCSKLALYNMENMPMA